jgi:threonine dehydrogenase-like Zn-dependent dehydrogenase
MLNFPYRRLFYIDELTALIREGKLVPRHFYSHVLPAEEIDECIRLIRTKEALKVVLRFD